MCQLESNSQLRSLRLGQDRMHTYELGEGRSEA